MRTLEAVLLASVVLGVAWLAGPWRTSRTVAAIATAAVAAAAAGQSLVEQPRWQLVPLYLAAVAILATAVVILIGRRDHVPLARTVTAAVLILTGAGAASAWALPVAVLPAPDGTSPVGTVTFTLTAVAEPADRTDAATATRTLVAQVWYPATADTVGARAPWLSDSDEVARAAAGELGLPRFALGHLGLVRSHATPGADPAVQGDELLPVVVYAHGRTGVPAIHVTLLESLASHGYVVAAVDHALGPLATAVSDDRVERLDPNVLPAEVVAKRFETASTRVVAMFADDVELLVDHLAAGAVESLAGHLDLERVALVGYSAGGGGAVLACAREVPCGAVVGLDPWVEPVPDDVVGAGLDVPLLSIRSEEWTGGSNDRRLRRLHAATEHDEGRVIVTGTTHRDLTVLPLLSPLTDLLGVSGDTPGERTHEILTGWTVRFLDHHLRGRGVDPLRVPPGFSEATVASNGG